jgi:hypothetical protein
MAAHVVSLVGKGNRCGKKGRHTFPVKVYFTYEPKIRCKRCYDLLLEKEKIGPEGT